MDEAWEAFHHAALGDVATKAVEATATSPPEVPVSLDPTIRSVVRTENAKFVCACPVGAGTSRKGLGALGQHEHADG